MNKWGTWSGCTKSCGKGVQTRRRTINQRAKFGGKACGKQVAKQHCNTRGCPVHCKLSQWSDWTECDKACGKGMTKRTRVVTRAPKNGGKACGARIAQKSCQISICAVDCKTSNYGAWSKCSKTCGGGEKYRTKSIISKSAYGGAICPSLKETLACNSRKCPIDCELSPWSHFSICSKTCGGGRKTRTRSVVTKRAFGGRGCETTKESQICNAADCRVANNWGNEKKASDKVKKASPDFKDFDAKQWKNFNWADFNAKSAEEQKKFLNAKKTLTKKATPTNFPTAHPTFAKKAMCKNGLESVAHGWAGAGYGANYCNLCKCTDGNLQCQKKQCGKVNRGKVCSHTTCKFVYSSALKEKVMAVSHHHAERHGAAHHCAYNLDSDSCQCNCFGAANKIWHAFSAKRDSVDALFGYEK
jgi:hypothetical protein